MAGVFPAADDPALSWVTCGSNGQVALPFGSPEYLGLGFSVFFMLILIEIFGSPFMRNCEIVIALIFGYFVAGAASYKDGSGSEKWYVLPDRINKVSCSCSPRVGSSLYSLSHEWLGQQRYQMSAKHPQERVCAGA